MVRVRELRSQSLSYRLNDVPVDVLSKAKKKSTICQKRGTAELLTDFLAAVFCRNNTRKECRLWLYLEPISKNKKTLADFQA